ncbi:MAG TPA: fused MFS/spermidine synthase [Candidatus Binatia bacterium]
MPRRALSRLALCFFLSGLGSLVLEVVWTRQLRLVFGSTTLAASTILVAYMLGLGLGGLFGGRLSRRIADGVRAYGLMEIAIGAYALVVPLAFARFPELNRAWLYALDFWPAAVTRFLLALAVLLIPTILMGATLPLLVAAVTRADARVGRATGLLYGINTLGAVAGVFLATFVLLPWLGLTGASWFGAGLDVVVGMVALVALPRVAAVAAGEGAHAPSLGEPAPELEPKAPARAAADRRAQGTVALLLVSYALVGFTALVYEVAWTRALASVLGSSIYAFAAMLGAFLAGIALGSLAVRGRIDAARNPLALLAAGLLALGALALATTLVLPLLPDLFLRFLEANGLDPGPILVLQVALAMLVMLPPTLVLGALFPLLTLLVSRHAADPGSAVGRVYFANTIGSASGAFCAGFVLIPHLGLRTTLALAAAINFATAGSVLLRLPWRRPLARVAAATPLALALLLLVAPPPLDPEALTRGVFNRPDAHLDFGIAMQPLEGVADDEMLLYRDGLNTTVSVHRKDGLLALKVNGKTDASTSIDMSTQVLLGEVPLLFGPPAKSVLVIGFASGVTVGSVARHPEVERIDAVEIEPGIIEASRFFDDVNGRPLEDPRVRLIVDDGRTYLSGTREKYDVIVSEPSNPWMSGVSNLFTREFFAVARGALKPDGRLLQWIHLYAMEPAALQSILAALRSEFRFVYGFFHSRGHADLLLLASNRPLKRDELPRWERLPASVREDLARIGTFSTADLWSLLYLLPEDVDALARRAPVVNSDDNLFIELGAPWMLYEDTVEPNWESFEVRRGVVPLLEELGEPLDEPTLAALANSYASARNDLPVATTLLAEATKHGRGGESIAAAVTIGRKMDEGHGEFALADQIASLDDALALAPRSLAARELRGRLRLEADDAAGALADADAALAVQPDDPRVRALRGRALLALGRAEEARREIDALTSTEYVRFDPSLWGDAIRARLEMGDDADAIALLETTLQTRHPSWHDGWRLLSEAYERAGRHADAERARRNADAVIANRAAQFRHDAAVALWSGNTEEAITYLSAALRLAPDDPKAQQELARLLATDAQP